VERVWSRLTGKGWVRRVPMVSPLGLESPLRPAGARPSIGAAQRLDE
jgi:hypothetical protein